MIALCNAQAKTPYISTYEVITWIFLDRLILDILERPRTGCFQRPELLHCVGANQQLYMKKGNNN